MSLSAWISVGIFIVAFILIIFEIFDKTIVVLLASSVLIILHIVPQKVAFSHIDQGVILFLVPMMMLMQVLQESGFFTYLGINVLKLSGGSPRKLMAYLIISTAFISAFIDNVTTVLVMTPLIIFTTKELGINPKPYLIASILSSNIGGTATLIGDPPNIMIGSASGLGFVDFIKNLAIPVLFMVVFLIIFYNMFELKDVRVSPLKMARVKTLNPAASIRDKSLMIRGLIGFGLALVGFCIHQYFRLEPATVALFASSFTLILTHKKVNLKKIYEGVEWGTILFFIGIFMLTGSLVETGVIKKIAIGIKNLSKGNIFLEASGILFIGGILSGIVDNIPLTAVFISIIKSMGGDVDLLWWALALGACLGGNATAVGASANVVVISLAQRSGIDLKFSEFTKKGIFVTLFNLVLAFIYLFIKYKVFK